MSVRQVGRQAVTHKLDFMRNWIFRLNWNKIASGQWNYAVRKTIQRQVHEQCARTHLMSDSCHCQTYFPISLSLFLSPGKKYGCDRHRPCPRRGRLHHHSNRSRMWWVPYGVFRRSHSRRGSWSETCNYYYFPAPVFIIKHTNNNHLWQWLGGEPFSVGFTISNIW